VSLVRREEGKNAKETRREEQKVGEELDPQIVQMLADCNAFNPRHPRFHLFSSSRFLRVLPFFAARFCSASSKLIARHDASGV
jgi:hypothetical protein